MSDEKNVLPESGAGRVMIIITSIIIVFVFLFFWLPDPLREPGINVVCQSNLKAFGIIFYMYAQNNLNSFPAPERWCDILSNGWINDSPEIFHCPSAQKAQCNYAMNQDCEPNSPPDTVLLFETKGGWNLSGGPELLTTENHPDHRCRVLFNDYSVGVINEEDINKLNWDKEEDKKN